MDKSKGTQEEPQLTVEEEIKDQVTDFLDDMIKDTEPPKEVDDGTQADPDAVADPEPADPTEPTEPVEPTEPTEPAEPAEPTEPAEPVEPLTPEEEVEAMRQQMNAMAEEKLKGSQPAPEPTPEPVPTPAPTPEPVVEDVKLEVTKEEFEGAIDSVDGFNKMLGKVNDGIEARNNGLKDAIVKALPSVINGVVKQIVDLRLAASDFYQMNEDLVSFKPFCSVVADQMFAANPDKEPGEVFALVGEEVRKRLKLEKGTRKSATTKKRSPALVNTKGKRDLPPPKVEGLQGDIDDFLS